MSHAKKKLSKKQSDFYQVIGSKGGKRTAQKKGRAHFVRAAKKSHIVRAHNRRLAAKAARAAKRLRDSAGSGKGTRSK